MRVAFDATVLGSGRGGDESYLRGLLGALALVADVSRDRFGLFLAPGSDVPAELAGHPAFAAHRVAAPGRLARYVVALPRAVAAARERYELVVSINHASPWSTLPRALVVHDLSFLRHPEFYPRRTRARLRWLVPLHVRQSRVIVTGSEFSRRDLIEVYRLSPERVVVVPPAIAVPSLGAAAPAAARRPYFLYVGNLHPRKNLAALVRAFALARDGGLAPEHELVIAGAPWWRDDAIGVDVRRLGDAVRLVGRVSDEERNALVRGATALVYPSLFEGIGLPPLEAMALGTPVIASNVAALPETCGDAAVLVDPRDPAAIASALVTVASDAGLRASLRERGRRRVSSFSARRTADTAYAAFARAIGHTPRSRAVPGIEEARGG